MRPSLKFVKCQSGFTQHDSYRAGFTLIELLIVMAILGILITGIMTLINPSEQLAKTRDTLKVTNISQLARSLISHHITKNSYPSQDNMWMNPLVNTGDLKSPPDNDTNVQDPCPFGTNTGNQNNFCYLTDGNSAVIYVVAESLVYKSKISCAGIVTIMWSSVDDRIGLFCDGPENPNTVSQVHL